MSLSELQNEQDAIRRELTRLMDRVEANDRKIQQLAGGGRGGGGFNGGGAPQGNVGFSASATRGGYAQPREREMAPQGRAGPSGVRLQSGLTVQSTRQAAATAVEKKPVSDPWEEPAQYKVSGSAVDRCEQLLRQSFERKFASRNRFNPAQAAGEFLRNLDTNRSGKLDQSEFAKVCQMLDFQADEKSMQGLFRRYDVDRSGYITIDELGRLLFKQDDDTVTKARTVIAKMREVLSLRAGGYSSLNALGRQFRIADRDKSGIMTKAEFDTALDLFFAYYKVNLTPAQKNSLFQFFDRDSSGTVSYDEFVRGVRGDMNDFRVGFVMQAFDILDKDRSGVISTQEIAGTYDVSQNPAVRSGKVTAREAIQNFMAQWDQNSDGSVTKDEFIEAYQWVSSSIDTDDYFELMMRNAWHISGGTGWSENTSNLRVLVIHFDGSQEVVEVKDDLGLRRDDYTGIMRKLQQQGVKNIKKIEVASGM
mmetsp:Transcript_34346/g.75097  ORF Transcript_34346/g.75097 Transcript_34346/m.75097 type:complete len:478 (-) Transcript_34346:253-1686(-)